MWVQPLDPKDPWRRKWQPSSVLLPGESHGQRSLAGYSPWGRKESHMTEHTHTYVLNVGLEEMVLKLRIKKEGKGMEMIHAQVSVYTGSNRVYVYSECLDCISLWLRKETAYCDRIMIHVTEKQRVFGSSIFPRMVINLWSGCP